LLFHFMESHSLAAKRAAFPATCSSPPSSSFGACGMVKYATLLQNFTKRRFLKAALSSLFRTGTVHVWHGVAVQSNIP
jgi:hypothetical protein